MNRRQKRKVIKVTILSAALSAMGLGTGIAAYSLIGKPVPDRFGCYNEAPRNGHYVLTDVSSPRFSVEQSRSLRRWFDQSFSLLGFNELFAVFTSEQREIASIAAPSFHVCGPARNSDQLEAIGADEVSAGYLNKQAARLYDKQLAPELEALLDPNPPKDRQQVHQSPVLELIGDLSRAPSFTSVRKLTVISDGVQNGLGGHFCFEKGALPPFKSFARRGVYERLKPEPLNGIEVEFLMLERPGYGKGSMKYCTETELRRFWTDYFKANSAASVKLIRIRAGTEG
ncbi:MAG: hypothetical protein ACPG4N_04820 [Gammaproteobacteria bacterium]